MFSTINVFAILLCLSFFGCKKIHWNKDGDSSRTKGIENLLDKNASLTSKIVPYCGNKISNKAPARWSNAVDSWISSLTLNSKGNQRKGLASAIKQSLANTPASVLESLLMMKVDLVIHDSAPAQCKSTVARLSKDKKEKVAEELNDSGFSEANHYGCVDSPGGKARPTIHIGGSPKLIDEKEKMSQQESFVRRLVVRNIGLMYGRFLPDFVETRFTKNSFNYFQAAKDKNASEGVLNSARMIEDSKSKLKDFRKVFDGYKAKLKADLLKKDGLEKAAPIMIVQNLISQGLVDEVEFNNIVFAEIFDSYYCSLTSRMYFESQYKNTAINFSKTGKELIETVTPKPPLKKKS